MIDLHWLLASENIYDSRLKIACNYILSLLTQWLGQYHIAAIFRLDISIFLRLILAKGHIKTSGFWGSSIRKYQNISFIDIYF